MPVSPPPTAHARYLIGFPSTVCDLDLSGAKKLKRVVFGVHIDHVESLAVVLNNIITPERANPDIKYIFVHMRSSFALEGLEPDDVTSEAVCQEALLLSPWVDLDNALVRLQAPYRVRVQVSWYDEKWDKAMEREQVKKLSTHLLPNAAKDEANYHFSLPPKWVTG